MTTLPPPQPDRRDRRRSWPPFLLLAGGLATGSLMTADPQRAALFGMEGPVCPAGSWLGEHVCPGCGLTRSTAMLLDGEFAAATLLNPASWVVVATFLGGAVIHGRILWRGERTPLDDRLLRVGRRAFVVGILAAWAFRATLAFSAA